MKKYIFTTYLYNPSTGKQPTPENDDWYGDELHTEEAVLDLIRNWCRYPENSSYRDLRFANGLIPAYVIECAENVEEPCWYDFEPIWCDFEPIDNIIYLSDYDKEYAETIAALTGRSPVLLPYNK